METFNNFYNQKREQIFVNELDAMCKNLALANVPFDTFWEQVGLPVLAEQNFSDPADLMRLWNDRLDEAGLWNKFKGLFGGGGGGDDEEHIQTMPAVGQGRHGYGGTGLERGQPDNGNGPDQDFRNPGKQRQLQQKADKIIAPVKNAFMNSIGGAVRNFIAQLEKAGHTQNNVNLWRVADIFKRHGFEQFMSKALEQPFDQYVSKAIKPRERVGGQSAYQGEFDKSRQQRPFSANVHAAPGGGGSFTGAKPDQATGRFLPTSSSGWGGQVDTNNAPEPPSLQRGEIPQTNVDPSLAKTRKAAKQAKPAAAPRGRGGKKTSKKSRK